MRSLMAASAASDVPSMRGQDQAGGGAGVQLAQHQAACLGAALGQQPGHVAPHRHQREHRDDQQ